MGELSVTSAIWNQCVDSLQQELSAQQFNTWIRPLMPSIEESSSEFCLMAPNRFVLDWVNDKFIVRIRELVLHFFSCAALAPPTDVVLKVTSRQLSAFQRATEEVKPEPQSRSNQSGFSSVPVDTHLTSPASIRSVSTNSASITSSVPISSVPISSVSLKSPSALENEASDFFQNPTVQNASAQKPDTQALKKHSGQQAIHQQSTAISMVDIEGGLKHRSGLNKAFTFNSFVEGKSNQMGLAAAQQVAENPGGSYNPLFIYGGVGLGKTHLMHAVGNGMLARNPNAKVVYLHSERFVADMVKALQLNAINDFKRYYRSVDALLIDDIQFFAGKDRSQEEFFHTFNALLEGNQQIILTCDRYPKVISNLEERLKSRFGWGLTVEVEPPELETRVAILMKRAEESTMDLPYDAAFFIAQKIRSNVRELEGALKRVIANASFTRRSISVDLVREALKDLLALQDKQVSISNIQRVVGEYYKVKVAEFTSKRRSRSVARPRQIAMALSKELTNHSLPEIGDAFGGRDHTTVLHACRKVKELCGEDTEIQQDWKNLQRLLTT